MSDCLARNPCILRIKDLTSSVPQYTCGTLNFRSPALASATDARISTVLFTLRQFARSENAIFGKSPKDRVGKSEHFSTKLFTIARCFPRWPILKLVYLKQVSVLIKPICDFHCTTYYALRPTYYSHCA